MDIQRITILGGRGKDGLAERVDQVELEMGNIVRMVIKMYIQTTLRKTACRDIQIPVSMRWKTKRSGYCYFRTKPVLMLAGIVRELLKNRVNPINMVGVLVPSPQVHAAWKVQRTEEYLKKNERWKQQRSHRRPVYWIRYEINILLAGMFSGSVLSFLIHDYGYQ